MTVRPSGSELTFEVVPPVRTLAPHWSQWPGETQSAWKPKNARGTWYVNDTSSQTRWVHHPRHRQTTCIRRHSLVFAVYEASFRPTDLTSHLKVVLECGCVLSRISDMSDENIGYKSPVLEDNSLPGGQVWELGLSVSRAAFPCHVCGCKKDIGYFIKIMWLQVQWIRFFIWHAPFPVASKNLKLYLSFLSTRVFELSQDTPCITTNSRWTRS